MPPLLANPVMHGCTTLTCGVQCAMWQGWRVQDPVQRKRKHKRTNIKWRPPRRVSCSSRYCQPFQLCSHNTPIRHEQAQQSCISGRSGRAGQGGRRKATVRASERQGMSKARPRGHVGEGADA
eukprot:347292-Chlamydomonas_euryale.AAC.1